MLELFASTLAKEEKGVGFSNSKKDKKVEAQK
jgi:hypothetical protein